MIAFGIFAVLVLGCTGAFVYGLVYDKLWLVGLAFVVALVCVLLIVPLSQGVWL